jgi:hypothetical protein
MYKVVDIAQPIPKFGFVHLERNFFEHIHTVVPMYIHMQVMFCSMGCYEFHVLLTLTHM